MICVFYSYKGGVGRSMALVNVAELFYQAGLAVLAVDWDLEAPGLERFFPEKAEEIIGHPGVMDMLQEYKQRMAQPATQESAEVFLPLESIEKYLFDLHPGQGGGRLRLLPAGQRNGEHFAQYAEAVRTFDWLNFYEEWEGELFFDWFRQKVEELADVVLVDSRTGITEIGGICTFQLADVVVLFCAPHQQSLTGTLEMAESLTQPEIEQLRKGRSLKILIVPARVEDRAEKELLEEFEREFIRQFERFIPQPLPQTGKLLWGLKIPHIPYYAFKEKIAAHEADPYEPMYNAFVALASVVAGLSPEKSALRETSFVEHFSRYLQAYEREVPFTPPSLLPSRKVLKVFVSSPADVLFEREQAFRTIEDVNRIQAMMGKPFGLEVYAWEGRTYPEAGLPQEVIQKQIPIDRCDIFIGIFWKRFGTPPGTVRPRDGRPYLSGTEQEIDEAFEARRKSPIGRPVIMLYRKTDPLPIKMTEEDYLQHARVIEFFRQCEPGGEHPALVCEFRGDQFGSLLTDHLLRVLRRLEEEEERIPEPVVPEPGVYPDSLARWLNSVGLRDNPFRSYLASEDPALPTYFVQLGRLRLSDLINARQSWVIFAREGSGKTTLRMMVAARCYPRNSQSDLLCVECGLDELEAVLKQASSLEAVEPVHWAQILVQLAGRHLPELRAKITTTLGPLPDGRDLLNALASTARTAGFRQILCLVDEVDELPAVQGQSEKMVHLLARLMAPELRKVNGITFYYFLPAHLEPLLQSRRADFRLDRCHVEYLQWEESDLERLIRQRMIAFSRDRVVPRQSLGELCDPAGGFAGSLEDELVALAEGNPRAVVYLANQLLRCHCRVDNPPRLIRRETWEQVKVEWWLRGRAQIFGFPGEGRGFRLWGERIFFQQQEVALSPRYHALLCCLVQAGGKICSQADLARAGWPDDDPAGVTKRAVDEAMRRMKNKLREQGIDPGWIETVRGRGYRIRASLEGEPAKPEA